MFLGSMPSPPAPPLMTALPKSTAKFAGARRDERAGARGADLRRCDRSSRLSPGKRRHQRDSAGGPEDTERFIADHGVANVGIGRYDPAAGAFQRAGSDFFVGRDVYAQQDFCAYFGLDALNRPARLAQRLSPRPMSRAPAETAAQTERVWPDQPARRKRDVPQAQHRRGLRQKAGRPAAAQAGAQRNSPASIAC
ncbi:MAG TPA: hypothetical protein VMU18_05420 [Rhodoblastus sp.]|nr:hypothetical protein [Rhodoblastus sp.]